MKKLFFLIFTTMNLGALTLYEAVTTALHTHPIVQERLNNFRATQQELKTAEAEYYPTIDARIAGGINSAGNLNSNVISPDPNYSNYESSLTVMQNLFNGFSTRYKVDYQESRVLAAAYHYVEKANDIALQTTNAYLNVLRSKELSATARENVEINMDMYNKVKTLYDGGLTTKSEVNKINASLSLAKSNFTVQTNNLRDALTKLKRLIGNKVNYETMQKPILNAKMPASLDRASIIAIANNPSMLVGKYNIQGAQALLKEGKKGYYPKVDLEINQFYNDANERINGFDQADDRFRARLVMNYNLYRGGADSATEQKNISKVNQEVQTLLSSKREVLEGIEFAWNAHDMINHQLIDLNEYTDYASKTLALYKDEFDMGRRSMLDIVAAQNDLINSRQQIINATYDELLSRYRILDAMGLMVVAILGDDGAFTNKVNLANNKAEIINDTLPVKLDQDNDTIADSIDLCDNSGNGEQVMPNGCRKTKAPEVNMPLQPELIPQVKIEPVIAPVQPQAVVEAVAQTQAPLDQDNDGIPDEKDLCADTPKNYKVDKDGCPNKLTLNIKYKYDSDLHDAASQPDIDQLVKFMQDNNRYTIEIQGHTDSRGEEIYNKKLSQKRADALKKILVQNGISDKRIKTIGLGESKPIASNFLEEGRAKNRRTEIIMHANRGVKK